MFAADLTPHLTSIAFGLSVAANVLLLGVWLITLAKLREAQREAETHSAMGDEFSAEAEYRLGENIALRQQIAELRRELDSAAVIPTQADDLPAGPVIWETQPGGRS